MNNFLKSALFPLSWKPEKNKPAMLDQEFFRKRTFSWNPCSAPIISLKMSQEWRISQDWFSYAANKSGTWLSTQPLTPLLQCPLVLIQSCFTTSCFYLSVSDYFTRNYNLHRKTDLHLPEPKLSLAKRAFRYLGSAFFNLLPHSIQNTESLSSFKVSIDAYNS